MREIHDSPDIRNALRGGYHDDNHCTCARCGEDIGDYTYFTEDGDMCGECFAEYMIDALETNPNMFADAFGIMVRYNG